MKNKKTILIVGGIFLLFVLLVLASDDSKTEPVQKQERVFQSDFSVPEKRSFYMGMLDFPYDYTLDAWKETMQTVSQHSDMFSVHFDTGVPWPEAYDKKEYHKEVRNKIKLRLDNKNPKTKKAYLAITPLNSVRDGIASYWGKEENLDLPKGWKDLKFSDERAVVAYVNHCENLIEEFKPDYFNYCIECNSNFKSADEKKFVEFLGFVSKVYSQLKVNHPNLPIFASLYVNNYMTTDKGVNQKLIEYSDMIAISSYPYWDLWEIDKEATGGYPASWFREIRELDENKPFAVAETGYIAEDLDIQVGLTNLATKGSEDGQERYLNNLLRELNEFDAEFMIWTIAIDYDLAFKNFGKGQPDWFTLWKDTGLFDGDKNSRKSLYLWDKWLEAEISR